MSLRVCTATVAPRASIAVAIFPSSFSLSFAAANASEKLLGKIATAIDALGATVAVQTLSDIEAVVGYASEISAAAAADALDLLNPRGTRTKKIAKAIREWRQAEQTVATARKATEGWKEKLSPSDTKAA